MLLIWFSENIVNYMTFGTWLNYLKLFFAISPTGPLADRSLVVVVVVVVIVVGCGLPPSAAAHAMAEGLDRRLG